MGPAYREYFFAAFVPLLSLLLLAPYFQARFTQFIVEHHNYGIEKVQLGVLWQQFFRVYAVILAMYLGALLPVVLMLAVSLAGVKSGDGHANAQPPSQYLILTVAYAGMIVPAAYARARYFNLIYGRLKVGTHSL